VRIDNVRFSSLPPNQIIKLYVRLRRRIKAMPIFQARAIPHDACAEGCQGRRHCRRRADYTHWFLSRSSMLLTPLLLIIY
jgi:hypothetical protein